MSSDGRPLGDKLRRLWRFSAVSVMNIVITQALLQGAYRWSPLGAAGSNVFAVTVSAIPAYLVMRRWVWGKHGSHSITREIVPFWAYTLLGLGLSTAAVAVADRHWHSATAASVTNIAAFGVLWVSKYMFLDQWMFTDRSSSPDSFGAGTGSTPGSAPK